MNDDARINYLGSVLFACAAALIIGNGQAAFACMCAWAAAYAGMYAAVQHGKNPFVNGIAHGLTLVAVCMMIWAFVDKF